MEGKKDSFRPFSYFPLFSSPPWEDLRDEEYLSRSAVYQTSLPLPPRHTQSHFPLMLSVPCDWLQSMECEQKREEEIHVTYGHCILPLAEVIMEPHIKIEILLVSLAEETHQAESPCRSTLGI